MSFRKKSLNILLISLLSISASLAQTPQIIQSGNVVALENEQVRFEFDLSSGTYSILKSSDNITVVSDAKLKINEGDPILHFVESYYDVVGNMFGVGYVYHLTCQFYFTVIRRVPKYLHK